MVESEGDEAVGDELEPAAAGSEMGVSGSVSATCELEPHAVSAIAKDAMNSEANRIPIDRHTSRET